MAQKQFLPGDVVLFYKSNPQKFFEGEIISSEPVLMVGNLVEFLDKISYSISTVKLQSPSGGELKVEVAHDIKNKERALRTGGSMELYPFEVCGIVQFGSQYLNCQLLEKGYLDPQRAMWKNIEGGTLPDLDTFIENKILEFLKSAKTSIDREEPIRLPQNFKSLIRIYNEKFQSS